MRKTACSMEFYQDPWELGRTHICGQHESSGFPKKLGDVFCIPLHGGVFLILWWHIIWWTRTYMVISGDIMNSHIYKHTIPPQVKWDPNRFCGRNKRDERMVTSWIRATWWQTKSSALAIVVNIYLRIRRIPQVNNHRLLITQPIMILFQGDFLVTGGEPVPRGKDCDICIYHISK